MKHPYAMILLCGQAASSATAQYCSPSFQNGCFNWRNQTITIGGINWSIGSSDCYTADYTAMSTTVDAGASVPMTVYSGVWCGCAVWVDLNNDQTFQDSENLFHQYVGGDPGYTYSFTITIPAGTNSGPHRMRVIGAWGSDGFLDTNINGYGPCGAFQYGNFDDFTVNVSGNTAVPEIGQAPSLTASPNPTTGLITVSTAGAGPEHITVRTMDGRTVKESHFNTATRTQEVDLGDLAAGMYVVMSGTADQVQSVRVVKQ